MPGGRGRMLVQLCCALLRRAHLMTKRYLEIVADPALLTVPALRDAFSFAIRIVFIAAFRHATLKDTAPRRKRSLPLSSKDVCMKRILLKLFTALFLLIPAVSPAGEVKLGGEMHFVANMQHALSTDTWMGWTPGQFVPFGVQQQAKMDFTYVANEDLSAFVQLQAGELHPLMGRPEWGLGPKFLSNGGNFTVNQAYLDWRVPGTKALVRMGLQPFELPMYTWFHGSLVHNDRMAGIRVSLPVSERLSFSAAWFRTAVATHAETSGGNFVALVGDLDLPSVKFSPYFIWANRAFADSLVFSVGHFWFLGAGAEYAPEGTPFRLTADFAYSSYKDHLNVWTGKTYDTKGWVGAASVSYKTGMGTPALKGWYSSGDGKGKPFASGQLQGLTSTCWPTTVYFGATYVPTAVGFDSTYYSMSRVPGTAGL